MTSISLLNRTKTLLPVVAAAGIWLGSALCSAAQAASFTLTQFTGDDSEVWVSLDELGDGNIGVNVAVNTAVAMADLRGIFFNVANESILPELSITNASSEIFDFEFAANGVTSVGARRDRVTLQGEPDLNPCLAGGASGCDGGLLIGTNGIGKDDVQQVNWTFTRNDGAALTLADFEGMAWGVRATSVGPAGNREGSSKLMGVFTSGPDATQVPEPGAISLIAGTALLIGLRRFPRAV